MLERYERICFEKSRIDGPDSDPDSGPDPGSDIGAGPGPGVSPGASPGPPAAVCLSPGHPLLDATVDLVLERYRGVLAEGAVLVDESDAAGEGEAIRSLFHFEIAVRDGHERRLGHPRIVSRQLRFVEVDAEAEADVDADADAGPSARSARDAGPAPYLDYRPIEDGERASIAARLDANWPGRSDQPGRPGRSGRELEDVAMKYARTHLVSSHAEEVRARRLPEVDRVEAQVTARLKREIVFWDNRALRLRDDERAGKAAGPVSAARAGARADELADRLARRRAALSRERDLAPLPPVIRGRALVVPIGLLRRLAIPERTRLEVRETTPEGRAEVERLAMEAVMAAERALGHEPRDVSAAKVGYDVESRDGRTGRLRFIEVKGRAGDAETVTVTHQEIRTALNKPDAFILAIVRVRDGYVSGPRYLRRPFRAEPDFDAVSVTYNLRELLARAEAPR